MINILIYLRKFNSLSAFFSKDPPSCNLLFSVYSLHFSFYFSQKFASLYARYARRTFINDSPRKKVKLTLSIPFVTLLSRFFVLLYPPIQLYSPYILSTWSDTFSPSLHLFLIYPFLSSIIFVPPSGINGVGATIPFYYLLSAYLFLYLSEQESLLFFILTEARPKLESSAGMSTI